MPLKMKQRLTVEIKHWPTTLLLVFMLCVAFGQGWGATVDLTWPPGDEDLFRDIASAQTIYDGHFGSDPLYRGEAAWYNPLVPSTVALSAHLTNASIPQLYARLGALLNLLAPVSFYICIAGLADRWTAVAATFAFLFISGNTLPSWASATYSPWLFTANLAQVLFYATLILYRQALRTFQSKWFITTGMLFGLTFLAHTAPALILGSIIIIVMAYELLYPPRANAVTRSRMIGCFLVLIASMMIVSLPFLATIAGRYHLRILNPAPSSWVYGPLLLANLEKSLGQLFAPQPLLFAIAVLGMLGVVKQRYKPLERGLLLLWTIISALWLGSTILWQVLQQNNVIFPNIVPGAHFLFYWKAAESALFGCGLIAVCRFSARAIGRGVRVSSFRVHPIAHGLLVGALALIFVGILPTYLTRAEFTALHESAQNIGQDQDKIAAYEWVRQNTQTDDVFLASDILVTFVVGPAGRKTVAANQLFSNPYVEWETRAIDRDAMLDALSLGDQNRYREIAQKYGVTWIIAAGNRAKGIDAASSNFLNKVFTRGRVSIYQVRSQ